MRRMFWLVTVALLAIATPSFAAANPFMDVPASHWAYDAVAQLAARGVVSGYPDGSYKGAQPATRYEMASVVARALAKVDLDKAGREDVELLKKLVVEFRDELDVLGVKADRIDSRLAVLERDLGGWSLAGELRFDAKFSDDNDEHEWYADDAALTGRNEFDLNRYRFWIRKRIDENTSFTARLGAGGSNDGDREVEWEHYYVTTKLPWDVGLTVGRYQFDWEGDLGLYADNEPWFGDITANALYLTKTWGMASFALAFARNGDDGSMGYDFDGDGAPDGLPIEQFLIAARAGFDFSERFGAGLLGYYFLTDREVDYATGETDSDFGTYGVYMRYSLAANIALKGLYYYQTQGDTVARAMSGGAGGYDDTANAWKAIVDVKQDALGFTSLWVEYGQMDNNFLGNNKLLHRGPYYNPSFGQNPYAFAGAEILRNQPNNLNTSQILFAYAQQQWSDRWRSYLRYVHVDYDTSYLDDAFGWTVGIGYRLSPAVEFELMYDYIDYGDGWMEGGARDTNYRWDSDSIIRFRTYVTF